MKKVLPRFLFAFLFSLIFMFESSAQDLYNLEEISKSAKTAYIKPDALDRLMIQLSSLESGIQPEQEALLLETYRIISQQYIANNHFSQAYKVFIILVDYKEGAIARNFMRTIDSTKKKIEVRRLNDGTELMNLQNQVQQLQIDNDLLISKRLNFKKYFSFIIIVLSSIFALMLGKTALKLIKIRSQLKENKEKMKAAHRVATIGAFSKGIVSEVRQKTGRMEDLTQKITTALTALATGDKRDLELTGEIRIQCKEIIKDLNASGIDA